MQQEEDDDVVLLGEKQAAAAGEGKAAAAEMMTAWLCSLGYQQYETLLMQAGFDSLRAAQHLDDEALQQCGVVLLGHRRVLSAAAAALRADRAVGEELEVRQLLQVRLHQQTPCLPSPSPSPSPAPSPSPTAARLTSPRTPSPVTSPRLPGSSPQGRASSRSRSPHAAQGQPGCGRTPPGPSPTRPDRGGASSGEGMRGLFGDLLEPQRMYSPHKPVPAGQFDTVNDLLGCIVGPDRSPAAAAAAAAKPSPPRPQQP